VVSSYLKGTDTDSKSNYYVSVLVLLVAALPIAVGRESCCSGTAGETGVPLKLTFPQNQFVN